MSTTEIVMEEPDSTPASPMPWPTVDLVSVEIVQPILGVAAIGPMDDFFDLDATSLHMVQMVSRVQQMFGIDLPLPDLFDEPTVSGLVWLIERELSQD